MNPDELANLADDFAWKAFMEQSADPPTAALMVAVAQARATAAVALAVNRLAEAMETRDR